MPAAELKLDAALVRSLLEEQHPDLAALPITLLANGWDNVLFRVGDELLARLPRRSQAVPLVEHELRWLPDLAPRLPLPIPAPVRAGRPSEGYPWPWTIVPWFDGATALDEPPTDRRAAAEALGAFLAALHEPAPPGAPANPYRGVPLTDRQALFETHLAALAAAVDAPRIEHLWAELASAPPAEGPALWVHGDVHPGNLVVRDGRLAAVIDLGDLCAGDRASDLVVAWMLFEGDDRAAFRTAAGARRPIDDATWRRARAWAIAVGLAISASSADNPSYARLGARTIEAALASG